LSERDVYEDEHPPAGFRSFRVVSSIPGKVGIVIWPADWADELFVERLRLELDVKDPPETPRLRVI